MTTSPEKREVLLANRHLYDTAAEHYETLDGRRSPALRQWLTRTLTALRMAAPGSCLLDVGAGSGLVSRQAEGIFTRRLAVDISPRILAVHRSNFDLGMAADVDALPLASGSVDAMICFAVLHHLFDFAGLAAEASRILRPGGVFYSDHDMDRAFHDRFAWPLAVYRKLRDAGGKYVSIPGITRSEYDLSEWQEKGIDAETLAGLFKAAGFDVSLTFHWYGLTPATDALFRDRHMPRGLAPLVRLWAVRH